jgi:HAE1 family hydrophobic/amphiphilic exporter-1/multidrug efflux pump
MRSFAVISISITLAAVFLPVIFLEGFVGRLFRIWCRNRCCRFNGICILNIDTNAKCLFNERRQKKSKFYNLTEPYFKKINSNYAEALGIYG